MKIAGVVVWYNPTEEDVACSITNSMVLDYLLIVDNSATSHEKLAKAIPSASYFWLGGNKGLGLALNFGVEKIHELYSQVQWVITLDQDSTMNLKFLSEYKYYLQHISDDTLFMLAPNYAISRKKSAQIKRRFERINLSMQSGCAFNIDMLRATGGFRQEYFIECIDFEICFRADRLGKKIIKCNEAILRHNPAIEYQVNFFNKKLTVGIASPLRYYYQCRNLLHLWIECRKFVLLRHIAQKFVKVILFFPDKKTYFKMMCAGFSDGIHNRLGEYKELK